MFAVEIIRRLGQRWPQSQLWSYFEILKGNN